MTLLHNTAALLREDATTVEVSHSNGGGYTYRVLRSLAAQLKPNDRVLVKNQHGIKFGQVIEVHAEPQIDPHAAYSYAWAFQKVDLDQIEYLQLQDELLVKKLQNLQRERLKQQALSALGIDASELPRLLNHGG